MAAQRNGAAGPEVDEQESRRVVAASGVRTGEQVAACLTGPRRERAVLDSRNEATALHGVPGAMTVPQLTLEETAAHRGKAAHAEVAGSARGAGRGRHRPSAAAPADPLRETGAQGPSRVLDALRAGTRMRRVGAALPAAKAEKPDGRR